MTVAYEPVWAIGTGQHGHPRPGRRSPSPPSQVVGKSLQFPAQRGSANSVRGKRQGRQRPGVDVAGRCRRSAGRRGQPQGGFVPGDCRRGRQSPDAVDGRNRLQAEIARCHNVSSLDRCFFHPVRDCEPVFDFHRPPAAGPRRRIWPAPSARREDKAPSAPRRAIFSPGSPSAWPWCGLPWRREPASPCGPRARTTIKPPATADETQLLPGNPPAAAGGNTNPFEAGDQGTKTAPATKTAPSTTPPAKSSSSVTPPASKTPASNAKPTPATSK